MVRRFLISALVFSGIAAAQQQDSSPAELWKEHMDAGMKLEKSGQYAEAKAELESAIDASVRKSESVFLAQIELGTVAASMGQYIEAEQWDNDAVRLGEELFGIESAQLAAPLTNLAALYRDQGDSARAEEFGRRALRLVSGRASADPAARAQVLGALGGILFRRGELEEAEADLRQSIRIAETLPAPGGILPADWNNLAGLYAGTGRYDEALSLYQTAYELCVKVNGSDDPNLFFILAGTAAVQARLGQYKEAVLSIQSAIQHADAGGPGSTLPVRDALLAEAEWLHKLKRERQAKQVRARAAQVAQAAARNSYSQYTVDARQVAQTMAKTAK
jgi:tetratricopeptide (TPR) repeat protein